jgi:hypothetical protein
MRRTRRVAVALGLVALVTMATGCEWLQPGFDANRSAYNPFEGTITTANVSDLTEAFRVPFVSNTGASKLVVDTRDVIVGGKGALNAYDRRTGVARWTTNVVPASTAPPVRVLDPFVVGGGEVVVSAGTLVGGYPGPGMVSDGITTRLDAASGAVVETSGPSSYVQAVRGSRWAGSNRLYPTRNSSGTYDPLLLEVNDRDDPSFHWGGRPSNSNDSFTINESLTLGTDRLYMRSNPALGEFSDEISAYDLTAPCQPDPVTGVPTCVTLWSTYVYNVGGDITLSEDGKTLLVPTEGSSGGVTALDADTGAVRWQSAGYSDFLEEVAVAGGLVYVSNTETVDVYAVGSCGADRCEPIWTVPLPFHATSSVILAGDVGYVGFGGGILAFPAAGCGVTTCQPLWSEPTLRESPTELAVAFGRLYAVTNTSLIGWALPT